MDKQTHKVAKKQKLRETKVGDKLEVDDKMRKSNILFLMSFEFIKHFILAKQKRESRLEFGVVQTEQVQYTEYLLNQFWSSCRLSCYSNS